jgi:hypothetical protein
VGLAAYAMDSHNCQRLIVDGMVRNEGDIWIRGATTYPISYRSLTPRRNECTNLLVPVCLSASHIAYGSIRMEPVFMVLGQVTGLASATAFDQGIPVQEVMPAGLMSRLEKDPYQDGRKPDILVDNADSSRVRIRGDWVSREVWMGQYRSDHLAHMPEPDETAEVVFYPDIPDEGGNYTAYLYAPWLPWKQHREGAYADSVRIAVSAEGTMDEELYACGTDWVKLGTYSFGEGDFVKIIATGNEKIVRADALLLVPVEER